MLFNSIEFAIFLPLVLILYWLIPKGNFKAQNVLLLISSYYFYACWDWRFLFLLIFSTLLDYYTAIKISDTTNKSKRKFWFWLSICTNLGFLGLFKYFNFFTASFSDAMSNLGLKTDPWTLNVILPVGISFYTFHGVSYVIDIYKDRIKAEKDFITYSVFVSFFPLLVAGPIERATHLLVQLKNKRTFNYNFAIDGVFQALWGLFKKIVIADNCAELVNLIFSSPDQSGSVRVLGALLFAFQIYCDFSGYSDIAIGVSKLFGIDLLTNFRFPYFSRDIAEFWRRWHISLSTWFRDYLYIPLGGSQGGTWMKVRNTFIIFLVSGFWHGANWTFIFWGALNAVYFLPLLLAKRNRANIDVVAQTRTFPSFMELSNMLLTFSLTVFAWIFFRSESVGHAFTYIHSIFNRTLFSIPKLKGVENTNMLLCMFFVAVLLFVEWNYRKKKFVFENIYAKNVFSQLAIIGTIVVLIFYFSGKSQNFIYFQF